MNLRLWFGISQAALVQVSPLRPGRPVNLKYLHDAPFFQNGAKSGFEVCFGRSTLGAGAKTRLHTPKAVRYHEQYHTL